MLEGDRPRLEARVLQQAQPVGAAEETIGGMNAVSPRSDLPRVNATEGSLADPVSPDSADGQPLLTRFSIPTPDRLQGRRGGSGRDRTDQTQQEA
jgi:hypothetical protein